MSEVPKLVGSTDIYSAYVYKLKKDKNNYGYPKAIVFYKGDYSVLYYLENDFSMNELHRAIRKGLKSPGLCTTTKDDFDKRYDFLYRIEFQAQRN